ncbi:MAG: phosphatase PAP2 family protein [Deltaproteobacteria bacterium]|nr:phosphatase PAP2 family protein [Deltaproteobacteria bacterium]
MTEMEIPWSERRPPSFALLAVTVGSAIVVAISVLLLDAMIAHTLAAYEPSSWWDAGVTLLEWVILLPLHKLALPVLLVVAMLATVLVKPWRGAAPALMTITAVHLISRLTTNWIKDGTDRLRPYEAMKRGVDGTFGWENGVAFPSGHVVLFASLVIPLLYAVPRTRRLGIPLVGIVVFIAAARMVVSAHWLSDTIGSITLVAAWTYLVSWGVRPSR